jgi:DNA-binding NarL/FixJ family response regulator
METIQVAISDTVYAAALRDALARTAACRIVAVEAPDPSVEGVLGVDADALERLPSQITAPERVVLITKNDAPHLARAWEAGVVSVVFETDPISTALLAIMSAKLRASKTARQDSAASGASRRMAKTGPRPAEPDEGG